MLHMIDTAWNVNEGNTVSKCNLIQIISRVSSIISNNRDMSGTPDEIFYFPKSKGGEKISLLFFVTFIII